MAVTLIEMAPRILQRVAAPETADYFRALHEGHGVQLLEETRVARLEGEGGRLAARCWRTGGCWRPISPSSASA